MFYILKPFLVTLLWIFQLVCYVLFFFMVLLLFFSVEPYKGYFNNDFGRLGLTEHEHDNNPIETYKRYWRGEIWL